MFTRNEQLLLQNYSAEELVEFSNMLNNYVLENFALNRIVNTAKKGVKLGIAKSMTIPGSPANKRISAEHTRFWNNIKSKPSEYKGPLSSSYESYVPKNVYKSYDRNYTTYKEAARNGGYERTIIPGDVPIETLQKGIDAGKAKGLYPRNSKMSGEYLHNNMKKASSAYENLGYAKYKQPDPEELYFRSLESKPEPTRWQKFKRGLGLSGE